MPDRPTIAYLSSIYGRLSHTFIRAEVERMRALGYRVETFSTRPTPPDEMIGAASQGEHEASEVILDVGALRLIGATFRELFRGPGRFFKAFGQAIRLGQPGIVGRLLPLIYLAEACWLAGRLRSKSVRHLVDHFGKNSAAIAMMTSTLTDVPYSMTIHGANEFDEPKGLALGMKVHESKFSVAISDFTRSQLCRWSDPADWSKIHVVHCGVGPGFLEEPLTAPPEVNRLINVGRVIELKGHMVLVKAAEALRDRGFDFEVVLVGDGPFRPTLEREIAARGLGDRFRLLGWKSSAEVRAEILASKAMVMPSFYEGLPVVLMESLALGRPVISTYVAGIPELVRPGQEGWLVPAGSVEALTEAIVELLESSPESLAELGRSGADRVAERHDPAIEARKLAALIGGLPSTASDPDSIPILLGAPTRR